MKVKKPIKCDCGKEFDDTDDFQFHWSHEHYVPKLLKQLDKGIKSSKLMSIIPNIKEPDENAEIRFNAYGHKMRLGALVWTRKLYGAKASGSFIREKYGQSPVIEKTPRRVTLRHTRQDWQCADCNNKIYEDDMHGSTYYDHYCLDCVTPFEPQTEVDFEW